MKAGRTHSHQDNPFFELDVQLSVPSVRLSPSLDDVQRSTNSAAKSVLGLVSCGLLLVRYEDAKLTVPPILNVDYDLG